MSIKSFDLALYCQRCLKPSLFLNFGAGHLELGPEILYDSRGAAPTRGPAGTTLCPACGGYMEMDVLAVDVTETELREKLRSALPHAH